MKCLCQNSESQSCELSFSKEFVKWDSCSTETLQLAIRHSKAINFQANFLDELKRLGVIPLSNKKLANTYLERIEDQGRDSKRKPFRSSSQNMLLHSANNLVTETKTTANITIRKRKKWLSRIIGLNKKSICVLLFSPTPPFLSAQRTIHIHQSFQNLI